MSAPPLPDVFGNYALGDFVEVVSPADISWLPQTAAWGWLGAILLAYGLYRAGRVLRRWYRNRYRREAATRLQQLAESCNPEALVGEVNRLLKLTALVAFSRQQVARLSGEDWVSFLNRQCPGQPFSPEQAGLLALGTYRAQALDAPGRQQLIAASLRWVREHENALDG